MLSTLFLFCAFRVDFFIPNVNVPAGFSICSTPRTLLETGQIELAVKISDYPPVQWVHSKVINSVQMCICIYRLSC